jgi:hypothetical protein
VQTVRLPCPLLVLGLSTTLLCRGLPAQEKPGAPKPDVPPPPARRFFDRPIDYWQQGLGFPDDKNEKKPAPKTAGPGQPPLPSKPTPSDWGQVVKQPDGSVAFYELPRPLVDVLEDPSPEKIQAYLDWKLTRAQKILRAAQAMKEFKGSHAGALEDFPLPLESPGGLPKKARGASEPAAPAQDAPGPERPRTPFSVTYFHRSGCPHCDSQDVILRRWLADKPEGKLALVDFGDQPELWQKYRVRGTPSLVIEAKGGSRPVFLEGLSQESELAQALRESSLPAPKKNPEGGGK